MHLSDFKVGGSRRDEHRRMKIIVPSGPRDPKGLLKAAIRDDDPVFCFADGTLWTGKEEVPEDPDFIILLSQVEVKLSLRVGSHATRVLGDGGYGIGQQPTKA
jgi:pyruvate dehydrogenase E1 component beta subunit